MALWVVRILFLGLCTLGGFAVSQVRPELIQSGGFAALIGFGFGGVLIAIDEMIKGFSLRAFSAATFGLLLGALIALVIDKSGLFIYAEERPVRWLIRLACFLGFGYIGMVLAMRGNKEDFSLIIPFVRFASQTKPEQLHVLDTSAIIDGRVADLVESNFLEGTLVVPQFVLNELRVIADSSDPLRQARGRRGLEVLDRIRQNARAEVKIHEATIPEEKEVDMKLVRLAHALTAKLITNDSNLAKVASLHSVRCVNLHEIARLMKPVLLPGERLSLRIVREGRERGQGIGYMTDGTMVVVHEAHQLVGQPADVEVQSVVQTGAGVIVFAHLTRDRISPPTRPSANEPVV